MLRDTAFPNHPNQQNQLCRSSIPDPDETKTMTAIAMSTNAYVSRGAMMMTMLLLLLLLLLIVATGKHHARYPSHV